ncbi:MAG: cupin domain-containing protein [Syntrophorhabdaceae bacterium]
MKITNLELTNTVKMTMEGAKGAWKQIPLARADGVPHYSLRVFTIEPGGHTPYHQHSFEHMNYIIEGEGTLVDATGKGNPVKRGDFCLVMPDEVHQYKNTAKDKTLVMICLVPKDYQ